MREVNLGAMLDAFTALGRLNAEVERIAAQSGNDIGDLEAAIAEFKKALPGWWFTTGTCSVSCDATIGPDRAYVADPILAIFDEGISIDLRQPSTAAAALRHVTREAVEALKDPEAYAKANPLFRDRQPVTPPTP